MDTIASSPQGESSLVRCSDLQPTVHSAQGVIYTNLLRGGQAIWIEAVWAEAERLGYIRSSPRLMGNGSGSDYVAVSASPDRLGRGHTLTAASLSVAILAAQGDIKLPRRWRVRLRNGNPLDLRRENLDVTPAERARSATRVLADVRKRQKLVAKGLDPNQVYAERRRAAKAARAAEAECPNRDVCEGVRGAPPKVSPRGGRQEASQEGR